MNAMIYHSVMSAAFTALEGQQEPLVAKAATARRSFEGQPGEAAGSFITDGMFAV